jgi:hypothetical protein
VLSQTNLANKLLLLTSELLKNNPTQSKLLGMQEHIEIMGFSLLTKDGVSFEADG